MEYNKLVRDRIPEIIEAEGKTYEIEVMGQEAYRVALRTKLIEEASEAAETDADLVKEIADLYEVIDTLISEFDLNKEAILQKQLERRENRGSFTKRIKLLHVK